MSRPLDGHLQRSLTKLRLAGFGSCSDLYSNKMTRPQGAGNALDEYSIRGNYQLSSDKCKLT